MNVYMPTRLKALRSRVSSVVQRLKTTTNPPHVRLEPNYLQIEVTGKCNFQCGFCGRESFTKDEHMSFEVFSKILDGFKDVKTLNLQGFGEPMMNTDLYKMISYSKEVKGAFVFFYSNGSMLNAKTSRRLIKAGLDQINISFDGAIAGTFEKLRPGADFARILKGLESLISAKKALKSPLPRITFRANCLKENFEEMPGIVAIAREMHIDEVSIMSLIEVKGTKLATKEQLPSSINKDSFVSMVETLERMKAEPGAKLNIDHVLLQIARDAVHDRELPDKGAEVKRPREYKRYCRWVTDRGYIDVSGIFMPCCYTPYYTGASAREGLHFDHSLHEQTIGEIWNSDEYKTLRSRIAEGNPPALCRTCPVLR